MGALRDGWREALSAVATPGELLVDPDACAAYGRDWSGRFEHLPAAVARPADTAAVARILAVCAELRLPVVPQGGRTGFVGGAVPAADGEAVVLSLERMTAVRAVDLDNRAVVVEAGATLASVQAALEPHGLSMPVDLGARGSARIGGLLATAAGGIRHVRDGALRDHVRGLEAVLGDGRILSGLGRLEKNNSGYAWPQLFCGSEGTLGVITAAVIGLVDRAPGRALAWLALADASALAPAVKRIRRHALGLLAALEFVDDKAMAAFGEAYPGTQAPGGPAPLYLLAETEGATDDLAASVLADIVMALVDDGLASDAVLAQDERDRRALWRLREGLPEAIGRLGSVRRYDVAVPVPSLPGLLVHAADAVRRGGLRARPVAYGHAAEGNVHLNMVLAPGEEEDGDALDELVYDAVLARQGTISAEHGIGRLKRDHLGRMRTPEEIEFMRQIKAICDPRGILNAGAVLPSF